MLVNPLIHTIIWYRSVLEISLNCDCFLEPNQCSVMYNFCNTYYANLSEFHIHDDLYIATNRRPFMSPGYCFFLKIIYVGLVAFLLIKHFFTHKL